MGLISEVLCLSLVGLWKILLAKWSYTLIYPVFIATFVEVYHPYWLSFVVSFLRIEINIYFHIKWMTFAWLVFYNGIRNTSPVFIAYLVLFPFTVCSNFYSVDFMPMNGEILLKKSGFCNLGRRSINRYSDKYFNCLYSEVQGNFREKRICKRSIKAMY